MALIVSLYGSGAWGEDPLERFNTVMEKTIVAFGNSVEEVTRRLGAPTGEEISPDVSPHEPSAHFEWVHLTYPRRHIALFRAPDKEFLVLVDTQQEGDIFGENIWVGSSRQDVVRELGEPLEMRDRAMIYEDEAGYTELAFFLNAQGVVERMMLSIMLD